MSISQYLLSWESYKSTVCNGFTHFQQNEEFVDMTIAADGHLVKVHKSIFALASPYIKSMLQSTPNQHPIFFLSNVSHEILNYILTYVYTGEVSVDVDKIQSFMKVAKDLRLSGLFDVPTPKVSTKKCKESDLEEQKYEDAVILENENQNEERVTGNAMLIDNISANEPVLTNIDVLDTTIAPQQMNVINLKNVNTHKLNSSSDINLDNKPDFIPNEDILNNRDSGLFTTADGYQFKLEIIQACNNPLDSTSIVVENTAGKTSDFMAVSQATNSAVNSTIIPQYTMSNRGSLQLILNRYMYHCHHQSHGGRKRRWRCIEYRSKQCPAFIDTDGEIMASRKFGHTHSFHDEKIRKKMKRNLIFTNLNILLEKQNKKKTEKLAN